MKRIEIVVSRGLQRIDSMHVTARLFVDGSNLVADHCRTTVRFPGPIDADSSLMVSLFGAVRAELQRLTAFSPGADPQQDELPF